MTFLQTWASFSYQIVKVLPDFYLDRSQEILYMLCKVFQATCIFSANTERNSHLLMALLPQDWLCE